MTRDSQAEFHATVVASGAASARLDEFPALRKALPKLAGPHVPGHFLKHADEQTVIALAAMQNAVEHFEIDTTEQSEWSIVGAPRFIGRIAGNGILSGFAREGGASVPTHAAAQYSLNSIPGAASIFFGIHGVAVGVGGGPWSIADGLISAMTIDGPQSTAGVWLLMAQWEPETALNESDVANANCQCHAVAFGLRPGVAERSASTLRLAFRASGPQLMSDANEPAVSEIAEQIARSHAGYNAEWSIRLPSGCFVELRLASAARVRRLAA